MLWYKHAVGNLSLTMGVHDLNSEFHASEFGGAFINSSFGIMPTAGNMPIPIFPKNALGLVVQYAVNDNLLLQTSLYDGDPLTLDEDKYNMDWSLSKDEGLLSVTEIQYSEIKESEWVGTYKLGVQYHTAEFENFADTTSIHNGNMGLYFIGDRLITSKLGAFLQVGIAPKDYNELPLYIGAGINVFAPINSREDDLLALGLAYAAVNDNINDYDKSGETAIELTYHFMLNDNIDIQPDFQYIINCGANSDNGNALVSGMRITIAY